jgi:hypothetical protein
MKEARACDQRNENWQSLRLIELGHQQSLFGDKIQPLFSIEPGKAAMATGAWRLKIVTCVDRWMTMVIKMKISRWQYLIGIRIQTKSFVDKIQYQFENISGIIEITRYQAEVSLRERVQILFRLYLVKTSINMTNLWVKRWKFNIFFKFYHNSSKQRCIGSFPSPVLELWGTE